MLKSKDFIIIYSPQKTISEVSESRRTNNAFPRLPPKMEPTTPNSLCRNVLDSISLKTRLIAGQERSANQCRAAQVSRSSDELGESCLAAPESTRMLSKSWRRRFATNNPRWSVALGGCLHHSLSPFIYFHVLQKLEQTQHLKFSLWPRNMRTTTTTTTTTATTTTTTTTTANQRTLRQDASSRSCQAGSVCQPMTQCPSFITERNRWRGIIHSNKIFIQLLVPKLNKRNSKTGVLVLDI